MSLPSARTRSIDPDGARLRRERGLAMADPDRLGARLTAIREDLGLSLEEAAARTGLTISYLY